jgi:protein-S-isoprenylcysteine O-methyltransferase Ste14
MAGWGVKATAVVCYTVALVGSAALGGLVLCLGLGFHPERSTLPLPWPWMTDLGLLLLFGLQHSVMARESFKRRWTRLVPACLERSVYAALSGLVLALLVLAWQPLGPTELWHGPPGLVVLPLLAGLGVALVNARFDHAGLFGLRQAWAGDRPGPADELLVVGPYRYVRHPLMACLLLFLWAQPVMPLTLAVLAGGLTLYVAVGLLLEERDLVRRFGAAYTAYRRRVPAFIPWRQPAPPARHLAGGPS